MVKALFCPETTFKPLRVAAALVKPTAPNSRSPILETMAFKTGLNSASIPVIFLAAILACRTAAEPSGDWVVCPVIASKTSTQSPTAYMLGTEVRIFSLTRMAHCPSSQPAILANLVSGRTPVAIIRSSASMGSSPKTAPSTISSPIIFSMAFPKITSMPSSSKYSWTIWAILGSRDRGTIWVCISVTVTFKPIFLSP